MTAPLPRNWTYLERTAGHVVDDVLRTLPGALQPHAQAVTIVFEPCPSAELLADMPEFDEDLLGLFTGTPYMDAEAGGDLFPPVIYLFLANLWDEADADPGVYREEVRVTLLHELGHYLGLDEDDLWARELD